MKNKMRTVTKISNSIAVVVSTLLAYSLYIVLEQLNMWFNFSSMTNFSFTAISTGVASVLGLWLVIFSLRSARVMKYLEEVVSELYQVSWPIKEDVSKSTLNVLALVIIASLLFIGLDVLFDYLATGILY